MSFSLPKSKHKKLTSPNPKWRRSNSDQASIRHFSRQLQTKQTQVYSTTDFAPDNILNTQTKLFSNILTLTRVIDV